MTKTFVRLSLRSALTRPSRMAHTIFIVAFGHELARNEENMESVSRALAEGSDQHRRPKGQI